MFDIHCHMMPGVDDGPADAKEALDMIGASYKDGIRHIAMTSHLNHPLAFPGEDDYDGIFCDFKKLLEERYPDLRIYPGAEVYVSRKMLSDMDKVDIRTINGTKYVLVEFSRSITFHEIDMAVHELKLMGYTAVIAHVEQYPSLRDKYEELRQLRHEGAVLQCNSECFNKTSRYYGIVEDLMKRGLVDLIASDCHNMGDRPPGLRKACESVKRKYGGQAADRIFLENPRKILEGEDLLALQAESRRTIAGKFYLKAIGIMAAVIVAGAAIIMSRGLLPSADMQVADQDPETVLDAEDGNTEYIDEVVSIDGSEEDVESTESIASEDGNHSPTSEADTGDQAEASGLETGEANEEEVAEKTHEDIMVEAYVSYLEELEGEYMVTCQTYYDMLKEAMDMEDEVARDEKIEEILDELGRAESRSDNQVYKVLYDMQNDLEEYDYDVAVVQDLRDHYLDVKLEVSENYKVQLEEYGNKI